MKLMETVVNSAGVIPLGLSNLIFFFLFRKVRKQLFHSCTFLLSLFFQDLLKPRFKGYHQMKLNALFCFIFIHILHLAPYVFIGSQYQLTSLLRFYLYIIWFCLLFQSIHLCPNFLLLHCSHFSFHST